ncbi:MAG: hypothetical protein GY716_12890 [bacterium]|nr:hypothetical protein [bacterium]
MHHDALLIGDPSSCDCRNASQRGLGFSETIVVMFVASLILLVTLPGMSRIYERQQAISSAMRIQSLVQSTRMAALKEKQAYRIVFNDENATYANTIEIQRNSGGSYTTLTDGVYDVESGIAIADDNAALASLDVGTRGACDSGKVLLRDGNGHVDVVSIQPTCRTSLN